MSFHVLFHTWESSETLRVRSCPWRKKCMKGKKKAICSDFTNNNLRYINVAAWQAFGHQSSVCAIVQLYFNFCRIALRRLEEKDDLVFNALTWDSGDFYSACCCLHRSMNFSLPLLLITAVYKLFGGQNSDTCLLLRMMEHQFGGTSWCYYYHSVMLRKKKKKKERRTSSC